MLFRSTDFIQDAAGESAEVIWGHGYDSNLGDNLSITIVATGFTSLEIGSYVLPERKMMDLDEENKIEIVNQMSSPFETASVTATLNQEPFLKSTEEVEVSNGMEQTENLKEESADQQEIKFDLFDEQPSATESFDAPSLEWEVQESVAPKVNVNGNDNNTSEQSEPEEIRHQLEDDSEEIGRAHV